MSEKTALLKALTIRMLIFSCIVFLLGIIIMPDVWAYGKGILFGTVFSILKLKLMENSFSTAVTKEPNKAKIYANVQYLIRYLLTGIVLVVGVLEPGIHIVGVILGLLSMKVAAYWYAKNQKPTPKDGSVAFEEWEEEEESTDF